MTDTFNFTVDAGTSGKVTFRTRSAQFGDGYKQEVADGLNNKVQAWTVTITDVYADELAPVLAFLDA